MTTNEPSASRNFIEQIIDADLASGKHQTIVTRFPPEPNGYLHIGHSKAIWLNFSLAQQYNGKCHLRFDDTNPCKEEDEYVQAIKEDISWLGWDWGENLFFSSDYFEKLYKWAVRLIEKGHAFVCELSPDEMREYRGTLTEPGKNSPFRDRPVEENLDLFKRMRAGEFKAGERTLRAKIDMANSNINLRDPIMYRILYAHHHRTGDKWCIYPMYDFTHGQSDSMEGITHSICTLEFQIHRPLYDWYLDALEEYHPRQYEFARMNLTYTVMSKRRLLTLVNEGHVSGWDDPRMPTISAIRRRGYTSAAIRRLCGATGVAKANSTVDLAMMEHFVREDLNKTSPRFMAVLNPLKVVITNYPEGEVEELEAVNNPEDESAGTRKIPFSREIYIERDDFMEDPPRKFFRLGPGREVRLRWAFFIKCENVIKDDNGEIVELHCTYDPETRGGNAPDGRKVKATMHWVSAAHAKACEVRQYNTLFARENPDDVEEGQTWLDNLNPQSLEVLTEAKLEPALAKLNPGDRCQFERLGYYCVDKDSTDELPVFNRTVTLKDAWARIQKQKQK